METSSTRRRVGIVGVLIGLPLLSNIASFVIFTPLFAPGQTVVPADFQRAGVYLGITVFTIELMGFLLVIWSLHGENTSLKDVVNFQRGKLRTYLFIGLIALLPTLAAGWLYVQAQVWAGIEINLAQMSLGEAMLWYGLAPITVALLEEIIWRGYTLPRLKGAWRSLLGSYPWIWIIC